MISKSKFSRRLRFSLVGNKASVLDHFVPTVFLSIL
jgi:hypothetical protein